MNEWFATGRIVLAILPLMVLEGAILLLWQRDAGANFAGQVIANLAAGAALMLALRAALVREAWPVVAVWLLAALGAHVCEVGTRLAGVRVTRSE